MRSLLFVLGDAERKLAKGLASAADAVIVDLEDSVSAVRKAAARDISRAFFNERTDFGPALWVRVNELAGGLTDDDLAALIPCRPAGILLPKATGRAAIEQLSAKLRGTFYQQDVMSPLARRECRLHPRGSAANHQHAFRFFSGQNVRKFLFASDGRILHARNGAPTLQASQTT